MNIATKARAAAIHCEAKKDGLRQTQDGLWRVTFTVSPLDMPAPLMAARPGTRYMLALVEIGDDEQPVSAPSGPAPSVGFHPADPQTPPEAEGRASVASREKPQRCLAGDRLVTRIALLCKERQFQEWANGKPLPAHVTAEQAEQVCAAWFRTKCRVGSRAEISANPAARQKALDLMTEYDIHIGKHAKDYTA